MLISFYKKKRWKIDSSVIISPEIYKNLFSNTPGNALKLVTVQNGQKCPLKQGNIYAKAYDSMW